MHLAKFGYDDKTPHFFPTWFSGLEYLGYVDQMCTIHIFYYFIHFFVSTVLLLLGIHIMLVLCQLLNVIRVLFFVSVDIAYLFIS